MLTILAFVVGLIVFAFILWLAVKYLGVPKEEEYPTRFPGVKDEDIIPSKPRTIKENKSEPEDEHIHTDEEEWTELAQEFRDNGKIWLYGKFSEYNKLSGINVPDILKNEVVGFLDWLKNNK